MITRDRALALLSECVGDEIWSVEHCRLRRVPQAWIEELSDAYESGFQHDRQTIYYQQHAVNQYHGVRDVHLALKVGESLGIDVDQVTATALTPTAIVGAIKEAVMEL